MTPALNADVRQSCTHLRITHSDRPFRMLYCCQLGALMQQALLTATDPEASGEVRDEPRARASRRCSDIADAQILLSAVLPHAYQLEVGAVFKARVVPHSRALPELTRPRQAG